MQVKADGQIVYLLDALISGGLRLRTGFVFVVRMLLDYLRGALFLFL